MDSWSYNVCMGKVHGWLVYLRITSKYNPSIPGQSGWLTFPASITPPSLDSPWMVGVTMYSRITFPASVTPPSLDSPWMVGVTMYSRITFPASVTPPSLDSPWMVGVTMYSRITFPASVTPPSLDSPWTVHGRLELQCIHR